MNPFVEMWLAQSRAMLEMQAQACAAGAEWMAKSPAHALMEPFITGPVLADAGNAERRAARLMQAWVGLHQAGMEQGAVVMGACVRAFGRFAETVAESGTLPDPMAMTGIWTGILEGEFAVMQRGAPFLEAQAAVLRGSADLSLAQQEIAERIGLAFGLPTRSELDDVHQTLTELRREVRALRRQGRRETQAVTVAVPERQAQPNFDVVMA